jgi:peptidoglycan/LPS O-acetylase OafA/YrhL
VSPAWLPSRYENVSFSWDLVTHLALVHNLFKDYNGGLGNSAFWTLGLEEQLYALYFFYLVLRRRLPSGRVLFVVGCLTLCWKCVLHVYFRTTQQWYYGSPVGEPPLELGIWLQWPFSYWFSWVLGAVAAEAYSGVIRLPEWCFGYGTAAGFAVVGLLSCEYLFVGNVTPRPDGRLAALTGISDWTPILGVISAFSEPAFAVAAWVILNRWVRAERAGRFHGHLVRPLAAIGLMSYSLYLVHMPVVSLGERILGFEALPMPWRALVRLGVHVPASILAAWLFYWLVERHFLSAGRASAVAKSGYAAGSLAAEATPVRT